MPPSDTDFLMPYAYYAFAAFAMFTLPRYAIADDFRASFATFAANSRRRRLRRRHADFSPLFRRSFATPAADFHFSIFAAAMLVDAFRRYMPRFRRHFSSLSPPPRAYAKRCHTALLLSPPLMP